MAWGNLNGDWDLCGFGFGNFYKGGMGKI